MLVGSIPSLWGVTRVSWKHNMNLWWSLRIRWFRAWFVPVLRRRGYRVTSATTPEVLRLLRGPEPFTRILVTNSPAPLLEFADDLRLLCPFNSSDPRMDAISQAAAWSESRSPRKNSCERWRNWKGLDIMPAAGLDYCFAGACLRTCSKYCST